jgi:hypothetical protein
MAIEHQKPGESPPLSLKKRIVNPIIIFLIIVGITIVLSVAGAFIGMIATGGYAIEWIVVIMLSGIVAGNILGCIAGFVIIRRVLHYEGSIWQATISWLAGWGIVVFLIWPSGIPDRADYDIVIAMCIFLPYLPIILGVIGYRLKKDIRK